MPGENYDVARHATPRIPRARTVAMVQGTFTTCDPARKTGASRRANRARQRNAGRHRARRPALKFFDTTILALPYGSFSLDHQRKSGFLTPTYSQNTRRGLEVALPFYWNIAPEQDLTLTPAYMTKRGEQLRTDYRYISSTYKGELHHEFMPRDSRAADDPQRFLAAASAADHATAGA
jgi:LPS-assembly protein